GGWYAAPEWSPDGEWIAFTRRSASGRSIGIIKLDGTGEKALTNGPADEGASWAASSRELIFDRVEATGASGLFRISLDGSEPRDHAVAIGARRAEEVRNYLVLLGVPAAQLGTMSWGKERPGLPRVVTVLVR